MNPTDPAHHPIPHPLAPKSQRTRYLPWLKVSVALRYALTFPWTPEPWQEVRQHVPWLWEEQRRTEFGNGATLAEMRPPPI